MKTLDFIDPGIIQVIAIAFISWLVILKIASMITGKLLPKILLQLQYYFETTKKITLWQQHVLYLALYALLVLSGTGCLIAIC